MSSYSIDVHFHMEKGMYARLVEHATELGVPLSAVVRDAVVNYFADIPEVTDPKFNSPHPEDPIWQLPSLSEAFGALGLPASGNAKNAGTAGGSQS